MRIMWNAVLYHGASQLGRIIFNAEQTCLAVDNQTQAGGEILAVHHVFLAVQDDQQPAVSQRVHICLISNRRKHSVTMRTIRCRSIHTDVFPCSQADAFAHRHTDAAIAECMHTPADDLLVVPNTHVE